MTTSSNGCSIYGNKLVLVASSLHADLVSFHLIVPKRQIHKRDKRTDQIISICFIIGLHKIIKEQMLSGIKVSPVTTANHGQTSTEPILLANTIQTQEQ